MIVKFIESIQIKLWEIFAELEYISYPWKTISPPQWAVERYSLNQQNEDILDDGYYYDWIKSHDEKINKLQEDIIYIFAKIEELKKNG
jgi:hypothetical protein